MFDGLKKRLNVFITGASGKAEGHLSATTKIKAAAFGAARLSESEIDEMVWQLQTDMLESDVSVETADYICEHLKKRLSGLELPANDFKDGIRREIRAAIDGAMTPEKEFDLLASAKASQKPYTILFLGVNGTGKTTSMAKMAKLLMDNNLSVVFAAGDTFRAGAIEQLREHAKRLGVKVVAHQRGADAAAVIYDAIEHAKARSIDVVLADTAGRMQSKTNLMEELRKIVRVNKPDAKIFIGDALAGNDAVEQARSFNDSVGFDAAVISKLDADAKGGSAISIIQATKRPIIFVGVGQGYGDIKPFDREWFITQILS